MSWYEIYLNEIKLKSDIDNYIQYKIQHKKKFINLIKKYSKDKKIIECGCGTGIISTYIASLGYDVTSVDIDKQILELAIDISKKFTSNNKPKFKLNDITSSNLNEHFNVSFSNGVLEHFSDLEIIRILKNQLENSDYVVFGIPTTFFNKSEALYGDERFIPIKYWRKLINSSDGVIVEETSYHYMTILEKIKNFNRIIRPKPFKVFVIKKKV